MVTEKLIINGVDIPLINGIGTVLTYSIKDIEQPDKRKASFSKTIKLPGSKVLNDLFNFIFEINSDSTFNPNLKADAIYLINDIAVFKGIIQLKQIHKLDNEHYTYDVVLLGELANIFVNIGDGYIDDADMNWDELDHNYDRTNIVNSWNTSYYLNGISTAFAYGSGYVYPMANYGWDGDQPDWNVEQFYPATYAKEYIDRIFSAAGFSYSSTFFDSAYFKKLIIPFSGKEFARSATDLSVMSLEYNTPIFNSTSTAAITTTTSGGITATNGNVHDLTRFTVQVDDASSQYTAATGIMTPASGNSGAYVYGVDLRFTVNLNPTSVNASNMISTFVVDLVVYQNAVPVDQFKAFIRPDGTIAAATYTTASSPTYEDSDYKNQIISDASVLPNSIYSRNASIPNRHVLPIQSNIYPGDAITVAIKGYFVPDAGETKNFEDIITGTKYDGAATINLIATSALQFNPLPTQYSYLNVIDYQTAIPKKIKKRDFFKSIIEMFNLYIEPDVDNPKVLTIEPREDFYTATVVDWSSKLDVSKDITYDMLASKNKSRYNYSYKEDADYYNKLYLDTWSRTYGNREIDIVNDFNKEDYNQSVIFSPTPSVGTQVHNRVIPAILGVDKDLQPQRTNSNIRILYYDGLKSSSTAFGIRQQTAPLTWNTNYHTSYPYAGHFNDPYSPTEDINWGLPKEIYWDATFGTITLTDNNLYNKYHKKELEENTDKDSKLVTAYFLLNPVDIYNLDFKVQYFFDNAYFRLQEVKYVPNSYDVSECVFLKLKTADSFAPTTLPLKNSYDQQFPFDETAPVMKYKTLGDGNVLTQKSSIVQGRDNYIAPSAKKVEISGDGNKVTSNSTNIYIKGDNNVIESNLKNVSLINTSNVTVTESNVTYVNNELRGAGSVVTITSDTTASEEVKLYLCDTSAGSVTVTLPTNPTQGKTWNFKKQSSSNIVRIKSSSPVLIDGAESENLTANNDSSIIQFDGRNYKII